MMNACSIDVIELIINNLSLKDLREFRCSNKDSNIITKSYKNDKMVYVLKSLKYFTSSFPNLKSINVTRRTNLSDIDFLCCHKIEFLDMHLCNIRLITDDAFRNLSNLKELNLQGCCSNGNRRYHFTNRMFDYLSNLEKLYIDYNHKITDQGLVKLLNIKDLTIIFCNNITGDGLSNLHSLVKLEIYHFDTLYDNDLKKLINLEELCMTFCHNITFASIISLQNLKKITFSTCEQLTCTNFDMLVKLEEVWITHCSVSNNDFMYLKNIKKLSIFGCNQINGEGFKYLQNIEVLSIYESPIMDCFLEDLTKLKNIKKVNIYRCYSLSYDAKKQLKEILGDKFIFD